ncbi:MAG: NAD-dependent epimerase/dehydratase family protein, partial [Methylacidiphilales bacterium]|nr:NAD-dependent epimerase/dehydratase family protein [Candidatus Methylacidiphilales bacterium]
MRRALVTGGRGFIGRHLVRSLRGLGCRVATVGRSPASDPSDIVLDEASWTPSALGDIIERERAGLDFPSCRIGDRDARAARPCKTCGRHSR